MAKHWQASYSHNHVEVRTETTKFNGHFLVVEQKLRFKMFSGTWSKEILRHYTTSNPAAIVLLYHPEDEIVLLLEQFRPGALGHSNNIASPWLLEPVAGSIETGSSAKDTATREAFEEAGCTILDLHPICKYLTSPGISNELVHVFCGKIDSYKTGIYGLENESEDIKLHAFPLKTAFQLLEDNNIINASGIISLQWLQLNLAKINKMWRSK